MADIKYLREILDRTPAAVSARNAFPQPGMRRDHHALSGPRGRRATPPPRNLQPRRVPGRG